MHGTRKRVIVKKPLLTYRSFVLLYRLLTLPLLRADLVFVLSTDPAHNRVWWPLWAYRGHRAEIFSPWSKSTFFGLLRFLSCCLIAPLVHPLNPNVVASLRCVWSSCV